MTAATGLAGYFNHVSPSNPLRLLPGAPTEISEPSSEFWIHPRVFSLMVMPRKPPNGGTQEAPHSNPGSTSAGSLYSLDVSSDVKVPHSVLDS